MKAYSLILCFAVLLSALLLSQSRRVRTKKDEPGASVPGPFAKKVPGPSAMLGEEASPAPALLDEAHSDVGGGASTRKKGPAPDNTHAPAPISLDEAHARHPAPVSHPSPKHAPAPRKRPRHEDFRV